jgi:hypothetical protein
MKTTHEDLETEARCLRDLLKQALEKISKLEEQFGANHHVSKQGLRASSQVRIKIFQELAEVSPQFLQGLLSLAHLLPVHEAQVVF